MQSLVVKDSSPIGGSNGPLQNDTRAAVQLLLADTYDAGIGKTPNNRLFNELQAILRLTSVTGNYEYTPGMVVSIDSIRVATFKKKCGKTAEKIAYQEKAIRANLRCILDIINVTYRPGKSLLVYEKVGNKIVGIKEAQTFEDVQRHMDAPNAAARRAEDAKDAVEAALKSLPVLLRA
jgi:hypothetical protein